MLALNFMSPDEFQKWKLTGGMLLLSLVCFICAGWLMPANCYFFETRQVDILCDSVDLTNSKPCPICRDEITRSIARIMGGLGVGFLLLSFAVPALRNFQKSPGQTRQDIRPKFTELIS